MLDYSLSLENERNNFYIKKNGFLLNICICLIVILSIVAIYCSVILIVPEIRYAEYKALPYTEYIELLSLM